MVLDFGMRGIKLLIDIGSASKKINFVIKTFCVADDWGEHTLIGFACIAAILLIERDRPCSSDQEEGDSAQHHKNCKKVENRLPAF